MITKSPRGGGKENLKIYPIDEMPGKGFQREVINGVHFQGITDPDPVEPFKSHDPISIFPYILPYTSL